MGIRLGTACLLLIVTGVTILSTSAIADERGISDPDDSASAIDIASLRQGHYQEYALYRMTAFEAWEPSDLADGRIVFYFNLDDDRQIERRGIVEYVGGGGTQMRSTVVNKSGDVIGRAIHRRPSSRSIELWFKRWQLKRAKQYRAFVKVKTAGSGDCSSEPCVDRAPDHGTVRHKLEKLCVSHEPTIAGTAGDDHIRGTRGSDIIDGRGGDDVIDGVSGSDAICGGGGNDVIDAGNGFVFLRGGRGDDRIEATGPKPEPCDDTGGYGSASCRYPEALLSGGAGNDLLIGGRRHEALLGGGGDDLLRARQWADTLDGGRGSDKARGGRGDDSCRRIEASHSCEG